MHILIKVSKGAKSFMKIYVYTRNPVFGLCDQSMPTQLQKQSDLCLYYLSSSVWLGISVLKFRTFTVCECVYLFVCLLVC